MIPDLTLNPVAPISKTAFLVLMMALLCQTLLFINNQIRFYALLSRNPLFPRPVWLSFEDEMKKLLVVSDAATTGTKCARHRGNYNREGKKNIFPEKCAETRKKNWHRV